MSIPLYGRITPIQGLMLGLGGEVIHTLHSATDEQRIVQMKESRRLLRSITGVDFGYDLNSWHCFLLDSEQFKGQYTFQYAWKVVERKIQELLRSPNQARLVDLVEADEKPAESKTWPSEWA